MTGYLVYRSATKATFNSIESVYCCAEFFPNVDRAKRFSGSVGPGESASVMYSLPAGVTRQWYELKNGIAVFWNGDIWVDSQGRSYERIGA